MSIPNGYIREVFLASFSRWFAIAFRERSERIQFFDFTENRIWDFWLCRPALSTLPRFAPNYYYYYVIKFKVILKWDTYTHIHSSGDIPKRDL